MNLNNIHQIPLFANFSDLEIAQISEMLTTRKYSAGNVLFQEGDPVSNFSIVAEGWIEIIQALGTEEERLLAVLGPGDFLGEISLLYQHRNRSASALAKTPVKLLEMSPLDFETLLRRQPLFAFRILEETSRRLRRTEEATIRDLQDKNRQLSQAYQELKAAQQHLIQKEILEHEINIARRIQEQLLPQQFPSFKGWDLSASWLPARTVSGDFYDFITISEEKLAVIIGDASGKGMPASLVMATTRSMIRALLNNEQGKKHYSPGTLLKQVNDLLVSDMPAATFITCFLAIIDIKTGIVRFANAGQSLPIQSSKNGISELRATGMPLGLMEGMEYEEKETRLIPGDGLLFYSDGLIEAHFPDGSMFGREFLHMIVGDNYDHPDLISVLVSHLSGTAGSGIEQEDDITLVLVRCSSILGA